MAQIKVEVSPKGLVHLIVVSDDGHRSDVPLLTSEAKNISDDLLKAIQHVERLTPWR